MSAVASRLDLCVCGHPRALHTPGTMQDATHCTYTGPSPVDPSRYGECACAGFTAVPRCDFCSAIPAPWTYPTGEVATLDVTGRTWISHADWAACESCAALIEAGDRRGLASAIFAGGDPVMASLPRKERREAVRHMMGVHERTFWRAREGARYRHP
jgi:hypothetical protein